MIRIKILNKKSLNEANATSMSQMYKVPVKFAEIINDPENWLSTNSKKEMDVSRKAVDVFILLSKIIYGAVYAGDAYTKAAKADLRQAEMRELIDVTSDQRYADYYAELATLLAYKQNVRSELLKAESINDIKAVIEKYKPQIAAKAISRFKESAVLSFEDGSFWSKLPEGDWPMCGTEMQHCGRPLAEDGQIYQLFDGDGKWNVTIEMRPNHDIVQIKGKQNEFPDKKYWDSVYAFINKYNADVKETLAPIEFLDKLA